MQFSVSPCPRDDRVAVSPYSRHRLVRKIKDLRKSAQVEVTLCPINKGPIQDIKDIGQFFTFFVDAQGNADFLRRLAANCIRGNMSAVKRGSALRAVPLGYIKRVLTPAGQLVKEVRAGDTNQGVTGDLRVEWVPDPETGPIVAELYRRYDTTDTGVRSLALWLTERGVPTSGVCGKGKAAAWGYNAVRWVLVNPWYVGDLHWGRRQYGRHATVAEAQCLRDHHPALVSRMLFERVQRKLTERKARTTPHTAERAAFLLSGLLRCGDCGTPMSGLTKKLKAGPALAYRCTRYHQTGDCFRNCIDEGVCPT